MSSVTDVGPKNVRPIKTFGPNVLIGHVYIFSQRILHTTAHPVHAQISYVISALMCDAQTVGQSKHRCCFCTLGLTVRG